MMSSASFGLPPVGSPPGNSAGGGGLASSSSHQIRLSRRSSVSLGAPLLSTLERTMSVLRGDIVEKMKESVGFELEPALAAHNHQRRLSRGSSTSTSQTYGGDDLYANDVGDSPIPVARRKHRKWRKPGKTASRNLDALGDGDGDGGDGVEDEKEVDEDDEDDEAEEEVRRSQRVRRRAQSFMGVETENDDDDDSLDEDKLRRRQERLLMERRRRAKQGVRASAVPDDDGGDGGKGDIGLMADAAAEAAARDPAMSTSSSMDSSSMMMASTVQPQLLSLASSSGVPTRGHHNRLIAHQPQPQPFRSPLLAQHDQTIKQWQQANKVHGRSANRLPGDDDDDDDDLEAGLPLLSRDKTTHGKTNRKHNKNGGGGDDDAAHHNQHHYHGYGGLEVRGDYEEAVMFLKDLCEALHLFGAPAHRIEYNMMRARYHAFASTLCAHLLVSVSCVRSSIDLFFSPSSCTSMRAPPAMAWTSWRPMQCFPSSAFCPSVHRTTSTCIRTMNALWLCVYVRACACV
jgi:hypothetical protein